MYFSTVFGRPYAIPPQRELYHFPCPISPQYTAPLIFYFKKLLEIFLGLYSVIGRVYTCSLFCPLGSLAVPDYSLASENSYLSASLFITMEEAVTHFLTHVLNLLTLKLA